MANLLVCTLLFLLFFQEAVLIKKTKKKTTKFKKFLTRNQFKYDLSLWILFVKKHLIPLFYLKKHFSKPIYY